MKEDNLTYLQKLFSLRIVFRATNTLNLELLEEMLDYIWVHVKPTSGEIVFNGNPITYELNTKARFDSKRYDNSMEMIDKIKDRIKILKGQLEVNDTEIDSMRCEFDDNDFLTLLRNPDSLTLDTDGAYEEVGNSIADLFEDAAETQVRTNALEIIKEHFGFYPSYVSGINKIIYEFLPNEILERFILEGSIIDPKFEEKYKLFKNYVYDTFKLFGFPTLMNGDVDDVREEYEGNYKKFKKQFKKTTGTTLKKRFIARMGIEG